MQLGEKEWTCDMGFSVLYQIKWNRAPGKCAPSSISVTFWAEAGTAERGLLNGTDTTPDEKCTRDWEISWWSVQGHWWPSPDTHHPMPKWLVVQSLGWKALETLLDQYFVFVIFRLCWHKCHQQKLLLRNGAGSVAVHIYIYTLSSTQGHKEHEARERLNHGAASQ